MTSTGHFLSLGTDVVWQMGAIPSLYLDTEEKGSERKLEAFSSPTLPHALAFATLVSDPNGCIYLSTI